MSGFVDGHAHLVHVALRKAQGMVQSTEAVADYHRDVAARGSSPMDEIPSTITVDDPEASLDAWLRKAAGLGIVEIWEAGLAGWDHWRVLTALRERGPLPCRVRILMASAHADPDGLAAARTGDEWLEIVGIKLYADGWLGPRTCAVRHSFADRDHDHGILFQDAETLARRIEPFAAGGWTTAVHAIGDRAVEAVLDAFGKVFDGPAPDDLARIEHAQLVGPDLVSRLAEQNVAVCLQPGFGVADAESARNGLDSETLEHAYDWGAMRDAGVTLLGGTDFPIEPLDPYINLRRLVTGLPDDVEQGEPVAPTLPLADAMAVMTGGLRPER